jgi:peptide/nickel transport system substrate-binding protein/oligopeptide transport system substrate-binding protein
MFNGMVPMKRYKRIALSLFFCLLTPLSLHLLFQNSYAEVKDREVPSEGGTYRRPLESMPRTLDPALARDFYSATIIQQLFDGLVQFDQNLNVIPAIAKSWKISPDGLTYTFFLREGVKFHNGREITAEDFVYSFTRIADPKNKSPGAHLLEKTSGFNEFQDGKTDSVKGFKSVDKLTFEIRLSEPFYPFISALGTFYLKVMPKKEIEKPDSAFSTNPIGSGPFKFLSMKEKEEIILESNPNYFEGKPYLNKIVFKIFHGAPAERILKEFKEGGLEESFVPPEEIENMVREKRYLFLQKPTLSLRFYGLNSLSKQLDNKILRKAINFAIDKKLIVSQIHKDQFHLAKGILPPGMPGYDPRKNPYPFNETQAAKLLSEAGYRKGRTLPNLDIWSNTKAEAALKELNEIQSQLKKVGIPTTLHFETNWPNFESLLRANKAPMFILMWYADFPDPDSLFYSLFHSKSRNNFVAYHRAEADLLIDKARAERDYLKRMEAYRKIEAIILEDAPIVPMINRLFQMVYQPYVNGIEVSALGGHYIPMKKIWLKREG